MQAAATYMAQQKQVELMHELYHAKCEESYPISAKTGAIMCVSLCHFVDNGTMAAANIDPTPTSEPENSHTTPTSSRYDVVSTSSTPMDELSRFVDHHLQGIRLGLHATIAGLVLLLARRVRRSPPFTTFTRQGLLEAAQNKPQQLWCRVVEPSSQGSTFQARHAPDWKAYAMPWASLATNDVLSFHLWPLDASSCTKPLFKAKQWVRIETLELSTSPTLVSATSLPVQAYTKSWGWQRRNVAEQLLMHGQAQLDWDVVLAMQPDRLDAKQPPVVANAAESTTPTHYQPAPGAPLEEYVQRLTAAEARARQAKRGMWSADDCDPADSVKERLARTIASFRKR